MHRSPCYAAALLAPLLLACPGDLKNPERFPPGPLPDCVGDIDVVGEIFANHCGTESCHQGSDPAAGLDLLGGDAFDQLAGVPSTQCDGRLRIDRDDVRSSFLLDKLRGPAFIPPGCGDPMPFASRLDGNQIACVERWVLENLQARRDGGSPSRDAGIGGSDADVAGARDAGMDTAGTDAGDAGDDAATDPCQPIADDPGFTLCERSADRCAGEFLSMQQCAAFCAAAGLSCVESYENVGAGECMFDPRLPLECADRGHMADYCVCGRL